MRRDVRARAIALCVCAAALVASVRCSESPEAPERTNPFDPGGAGDGDALDLRALFLGNDVSLFWSAVPIEGRSASVVYRLSRDGEAFERLGELPGSVLGFRDNDPHRDTLNIYAVTLVNNRGDESPLDAFAPDTVDAAPLLVIGTEEEPLDSTATLLVHVAFYSDRSESVFLADSVVNVDGVQELVSPIAYLPDPAGYDFLLREGAPASHMKNVYGRTRRTDGTLSPIASDAVAIPRLSVTISVDGDDAGPHLTGRRSIAVALAAAGAESMEVTFDSTFSDTWLPFAAAFEESLPGPNLRQLRARVRDRFGAVAQDTFFVIGDELRDVSLVIDGDAAQTRLCTATVEAVDGKVLEICLSPVPIDTIAPSNDPGCTALMPYTGPIRDWPLEPCVDVAHVYARVANDWIPEGRIVEFTDSIYVVGGAPELEIEFPATDGSDTLRIGQPVQLRGFAKGAQCFPDVDYVRLSVRFEGASAPETLALGDAALRPDSLDASRSVWSMTWTPPASAAPGPIEVVAAMSVESICSVVRSVIATVASVAP